MSVALSRCTHPSPPHPIVARPSKLRAAASRAGTKRNGLALFILLVLVVVVRQCSPPVHEACGTTPPITIAPALSRPAVTLHVSSSKRQSSAQVAVSEEAVSFAIELRRQFLLNKQGRSNTSRTQSSAHNSGPRSWMCASSGGGVFEEPLPRFSPSRHALRSGGAVRGYTVFALPAALCRQPVLTLDLQGGPLHWSHFTTAGTDESCLSGLQSVPMATFPLQAAGGWPLQGEVGVCCAICMAFRSCSAFAVVPSNDVGASESARCDLFRCATSTVHPTMTNTPMGEGVLLHVVLHKRRLVMEPEWLHDALHRDGDHHSSGEGDNVLLLLRSLGGFVWTMEEFDVPFPRNAQVVLLDSSFGDVRTDVDASLDVRVVALDRSQALPDAAGVAEPSMWGLTHDHAPSMTLDDQSDDALCSRWRQWLHREGRGTTTTRPFPGATTLHHGTVAAIGGRAPLHGLKLTNVGAFVGHTLCVYVEHLGRVHKFAFALKSTRLHRRPPVLPLGEGTEPPMFLLPNPSGMKVVPAGVCLGRSTHADATVTDAVEDRLWCLQGGLHLSSSPLFEGTTTVTLLHVEWGTICVLHVYVVSDAANTTAAAHPRRPTIEVIDGFYAKVGPYGEAIFNNTLLRTKGTVDAAAQGLLTIVFEVFAYVGDTLQHRSGAPLASWNTSWENVFGGRWRERDDKDNGNIRRQIQQDVIRAVTSDAVAKNRQPILISTAVHECASCVVQLLSNLRQYAMPCVVVVHVSPARSGGKLLMDVVRAAVAAEAAGASPLSQMPVYINDRNTLSIDGGISSLLHLVFLRNAAYMMQHHPDVAWSHVLWLQSNERFLKPGIVEYIQQFDLSVPRVASANSAQAGLAFLHAHPARHLTVREVLSIAQHAKSPLLSQLRDANRRAFFQLLAPRTRSGLSKHPSTLTTIASMLHLRIFTSQNTHSEGTFVSRAIAECLAALLDASFDGEDVAAGGEPTYSHMEFLWMHLLDLATMRPLCHLDQNGTLATLAEHHVVIGQRTAFLASIRRGYQVSEEDIRMMRMGTHRGPSAPDALGLLAHRPPFSAKRFSRNARSIVTNTTALD